MLLLLFRYVLGGAIQIPGGSYVDYVVPASSSRRCSSGAMTTAIGLAQDLKSGIIDRFRSLPDGALGRPRRADGGRPGPQRLLADPDGRSSGLAVGLPVPRTLPAILAGMALILVFGYSFSWVYAAIGLATKDPRRPRSPASCPSSS